MDLPEYTVKIRDAKAEGVREDIEWLEREYGDQEVTFREVEETLSQDAINMYKVIESLDISNDFVLRLVLEVIEANNLDLSEEALEGLEVLTRGEEEIDE